VITSAFVVKSELFGQLDPHSTVERASKHGKLCSANEHAGRHSVGYDGAASEARSLHSRRAASAEGIQNKVARLRQQLD